MVNAREALPAGMAPSVTAPEIAPQAHPGERRQAARTLFAIDVVILQCSCTEGRSLLYTGLIERLTQSLRTLAASVVQFSKFNETRSSNVSDSAWGRYPTECSAKATEHVLCAKS